MVLYRGDTQGNMCTMLNVAVLLGLMLLLFVWWKKSRERANRNEERRKGGEMESDTT